MIDLSSQMKKLDAQRATLQTELKSLEKQMKTLYMEIKKLTNISEKGKDCADLYRKSIRHNGIYKIDPDGKGYFKVFCDMTSSGGVNTSGTKKYAEYEDFVVKNENSKYQLSIGNYTGTALDALSYHNNMKFSTKDSDNDKSGSGNCATSYTGAWWYNACDQSNLNGKNLGWLNFNNVKTSEMKIKP
ncbi:angiopoietin-related protein 7-like [Xenia sp. Carnegie-2017]|uniref:angiopoietin-related protein 7-like n=1 Tax=Xenia sp. Carnegie-2017 TaxID=2897299 RepID=UPI001F0488C1|nr:angiopoietin-related protein 7-like [Xenia sp. Carnegie-2017]